MSLYEIFSAAGAPYAAGLFEFPNAGVETRYANALKRFWETAELPAYDGGRLYPCGQHPFYFYGPIMAYCPH